jgi:hypothetical protein
VLLLGGLHFPMQRILVAFGLIGILRRKSHSSSSLFSRGVNRIDIAVISMTVLIAINAVMLWQESGALTNQLGEFYTVFGTYFFLRFFIRDQEDIELTIRLLVFIAVTIALIMAYEQFRGWNPYALLGGARASFYASAMSRDGRFRAVACFAHPILAGTFGAIVLPLFVGLWWTDRKQRSISLIGMFSATVMIIASNSSTPITAYVAGVVGLCLWPLRKQMRLIRWGIVLALVSLHMVMKAPVWHLISRVDLSGGSSSYHRYELINQFIRHFGDWWLLGTKVNADWGWDMWDTANQYVGLGEGSGVGPLILFLAVIVYGFKYLGRARRAAASKQHALFLWSLGAALFAHVVAFFGISYFDQTIVVWYALLAMISAAIAVSHKKEAGLLAFSGDMEPDVSLLRLAPQEFQVSTATASHSGPLWMRSNGGVDENNPSLKP